MHEKEQWINAIRDNSNETIASIILADIERIEKQQQEIERLNNKLELISTIVEREFPPNEFITYKIKKILKGEDKKVKTMKKYIPLFVVKSKVTGHEYNVYETKTKKSGMKFYKIYNYFTDKFEWLFYDIFEEVGEKE